MLLKKQKKDKANFESQILSNRDALKQLLARSRYFLHKNKSRWTQNQTQRAALLFELYPDILKVYNLRVNLKCWGGIEDFIT
ncbi:transposase [Flavobacterium ovatum]|uniref:transposase n=1 Tax=Flavobacterium ovatum TaxID=1928857 RepID=UPI00344E37E4